MIVYQIKNKTDEKSYIGQSTYCFHVRYGSISGKWWNNVNNKYLKNAINKHGPDNFEIVILASEIATIEELDEAEKFYIEKLETITPKGYNYTNGGQDVRGAWFDDEKCDELAIRASGKSKRTLLNNRTGKIHDFVNISRFSRENDLSGPTVSRVLSGEFRFCGDWSLPETPKQRFEVSHEDGRKFMLLEGGVATFCRKFNLSQGNLFATTAGKAISTHGWSCRVFTPTSLEEVTPIENQNNFK